MNNLSELELLNFALQNDMIDISTIQKKVLMSEREKYLEMHKFDIWQGKNGLWYTYLPDDKKGRKLKKRKTKTEIEDCIVNYWKSQSKEEERKSKAQRITLFEIFPDWLDYKQVHTNSTSYIKRIACDWKKYYTKETELINMPLKDMTGLYLDTWAHGMIKKYDLTKKSYYNMSIILRQCLDYAVDCGYISQNVFSDIKINTKLFRRTKKKTGRSEVYTVEEEKKLILDMIRRFNADPSNTAPLAVILAFEIGVRIGELCALKFEDIEGNYIHIQRQEVREFEKADRYTMKSKCLRIVDYTKSDDGYRDIYLTDTARKIIDLAAKTNDMNREPNKDGFIFVKDGKNISNYCIHGLILRGCESVGMSKKTCHKIRKTYISTLIDSGLNIDQIRRMAGHSDERTTYGNYCYNRMTDQQTENAIEKALNSEKVIKGNQFTMIIRQRENSVNTRPQAEKYG